MRFGSRVSVLRGGHASWGPGSLRTVRGILVGARGHQRQVRLTQDDPDDTVGWNKKGDVGWWSESAVTRRK